MFLQRIFSALISFMKFYSKFTALLCFIYFLLLASTMPAACAEQQGDTSSVKIENKMPVVGIGYGAMSFIGSVGNSYLNTPFLYKGGLQLDVQLHSRSNWEIFFHLLSGKVYGEEKHSTRTLTSCRIF